jgi:ABC-type lipoprotein release transport system permease subunit
MREALVAGSPYSESVRLDISSDARVLIYTAALSFATTLFFGLAPAWRASRTNAMGALKGERLPQPGVD